MAQLSQCKNANVPNRDRLGVSEAGRMISLQARYERVISLSLSTWIVRRPAVRSLRAALRVEAAEPCTGPCPSSYCTARPGRGGATWGNGSDPCGESPHRTVCGPTPVQWQWGPGYPVTSRAAADTVALSGAGPGRGAQLDFTRGGYSVTRRSSTRVECGLNAFHVSPMDLKQR
eukprot:368114-Hanusia_phi.AAC.1